MPDDNLSRAYSPQSGDARQRMGLYGDEINRGC